MVEVVDIHVDTVFRLVMHVPGGGIEPRIYKSFLAGVLINRKEPEPCAPIDVAFASTPIAEHVTVGVKNGLVPVLAPSI